MNILWSGFISLLLVFCIDHCQCENVTLDNKEDLEKLENWAFSSEFYMYGQSLKELESAITKENSSVTVPASFWKEFNAPANGIWGWTHYPTSGDATQSISFYSLSDELIGNVSLSYFIYGNGHIIISSGNIMRTLENCQGSVPVTTTTTTTTEPSRSNGESETEAEVKNSTGQCKTGNRQWNHTIVDLVSCNSTLFCLGVENFTVKLYFEETNDNFSTNGGFIFLDKLVAITHTPIQLPLPIDESSNSTTTTSTPKPTESTTKSLSTILKPGFLLIFLTILVDHIFNPVKN